MIYRWNQLVTDVFHPYENLVADFLREYGVAAGPSAGANPDNVWSEDFLLWENRLLPKLYRMLDLVCGWATLRGVRLALSSVDHPDRPPSIDTASLLDLSPVEALDEYQRLSDGYQQRKQKLLRSLPEPSCRRMEGLIARQEALQFSSWPAQVAGNILYAYLATVSALSAVEGKGECTALTQQLWEALRDYLNPPSDRRDGSLDM